MERSIVSTSRLNERRLGYSFGGTTSAPVERWPSWRRGKLQTSSAATRRGNFPLRSQRRHMINSIMRRSPEQREAIYCCQCGADGRARTGTARQHQSRHSEKVRVGLWRRVPAHRTCSARAAHHTPSVSTRGLAQSRIPVELQVRGHLHGVRRRDLRGVLSCGPTAVTAPAGTRFVSGLTVRLPVRCCLGERLLALDCKLALVGS